MLQNSIAGPVSERTFKSGVDDCINTFQLKTFKCGVDDCINTFKFKTFKCGVDMFIWRAYACTNVMYMQMAKVH